MKKYKYIFSFFKNKNKKRRRRRNNKCFVCLYESFSASTHFSVWFLLQMHCISLVQLVCFCFNFCLASSPRLCFFLLLFVPHVTDTRSCLYTCVLIKIENAHTDDGELISVGMHIPSLTHRYCNYLYILLLLALVVFHSLTSIQC